MICKNLMIINAEQRGIFVNMHGVGKSEAARAALPQDAWSVAALHIVTTLTGSALLALALAHDVRDAGQVWDAAHVDEDWNIEQWGVDEEAAARRATRLRDFEAAVTVLAAAKALAAKGP